MLNEMTDADKIMNPLAASFLKGVCSVKQFKTKSNKVSYCWRYCIRAIKMSFYIRYIYPFVPFKICVSCFSCFLFFISVFYILDYAYTSCVDIWCINAGLDEQSCFSSSPSLCWLCIVSIVPFPQCQINMITMTNIYDNDSACCCERRQLKSEGVRYFSASSHDGGDEDSSEASEFDTTKNVRTFFRLRVPNIYNSLVCNWKIKNRHHIGIAPPVWETQQVWPSTACCWFRYQVAFHSVNRATLWKALRGEGLPKVFVKLMEHLHVQTGAKLYSLIFSALCIQFL